MNSASSSVQRNSACWSWGGNCSRMRARASGDSAASFAPSDGSTSRTSAALPEPELAQHPGVALVHLHERARRAGAGDRVAGCVLADARAAVQDACREAILAVALGELGDLLERDAAADEVATVQCVPGAAVEDGREREQAVHRERDDDAGADQLREGHPPRAPGAVLPEMSEPFSQFTEGPTPVAC